MYLSDILNIKAGTLIKGIRLETWPGSSPRQTRFFMDVCGWSIDGVPLSELKEDDTTRIVPLTLIEDRVINVVAKELVPTNVATDLTTTALLVNSRVLREAFTVHREFRSIEAGAIVGMSLGTTIVSFQPEAPEIYRKGDASLACFHCVLMKEEVCWIRMMSQKRVAFFDEKNIQGAMSQTEMEII